MDADVEPERIARKYFKEEDPVGKILIFTGPYRKIRKKEVLPAMALM